MSNGYVETLRGLVDEYAYSSHPPWRLRPKIGKIGA